MGGKAKRKIGKTDFQDVRQVHFANWTREGFESLLLRHFNMADKKNSHRIWHQNFPKDILVRRAWVRQNKTVFVSYLLGWRHVSATVGPQWPKHVVSLINRIQRQLYISVINQLDEQKFCFTISLFHASTCFEDMCSSSGGQNCITQPLVSSHL